jgi:hypothetical protein
MAGLAGVSGKDDPPLAPLPVDMSNQMKDIYGTESFPPVDGWCRFVSSRRLSLLAPPALLCM